MKYLILGSSGQIGFEMCKFLKKNNEEVVEFDIFKSKDQDLRISNILDCILPEIDFVIFLAFDVGGSRYLENYQHTYEFIQNNTKIILNTFDSIKKFDKPFIFASSQMANMSYSPYGVCKTLGELFTVSLGGLIVKFWNVFGTERDSEKYHVITDFIFKAKKGVIDMMTDGTEERQFLHAEDCCNAMYILSKKYNEIDRGKSLDITSFEWTKIFEIAEKIKERIPCKISQSMKKDMIQMNKKNEPDRYILEFWRPKISLDKGIDKVINDIKNL